MVSSGLVWPVLQYLDPGELESSTLLGRSITVMRGFAKVICNQ